MAITTVTKPWGKEILVAHTDRYALKDIHMKAGTRSSLQSHVRKHETILVVSGRIAVETGPNPTELTSRTYGPDESYTVAPGTVHRVTVLEDSRLIEASTPELDDLIRHADDFGRGSPGA
ncbi:MAG: hypothetical protein RLO51_01080 [Thalassobaculum sp.]|uniref:cupin domain-containing protein n=1 Tax=Thalassobaculum sp. TaxID=2022740 RepID=UPI0032EBFF23